MRDYHLPGRSAVFSSNGLCATSHPLAAKTAIDILQRGGNAMDAAIAGAVILGFCEPQMAGIGGDCFVLFSPAGSHEIKAMNGSGKAPMGLSSDMLRDKGHNSIPKQGVEAVTIPGAIDAFCQLSCDWGKLGINALLAPAVHYAKEGIPVAPRVGHDWNNAVHKLHPSALDKFSWSGKAPNVGDTFTAKGQAVALNEIQRKGRDGFYTGAVAEDMVFSLNALGGKHTMEDFAQQKAFYTNPISGSYKYANLVEHPPNGQGATAILMLNILSEFDLSKFEPFGAERAHLEAEATKLAYDLRNRIIADPNHTNALDEMLSMQTAKNLAGMIDLKKAQPNLSALSEASHKDTIYITVVDKDRMIVSLIYSIFDSFGSGIASNQYGILFHNRGAGFNLIKGHPNELKPGTRPMHTIIPAILRSKEKIILPFGVMGGQYQPVGHARIVSNFIDYNLSLQEAIDAPRSFSDQGLMKVERGYAPRVAQQLKEMGHNVTQDMEAIGGSQAIYIHGSGVLEGASDPRKDGCALGY
ncbi:MAG: gamma-glutamyltransferase [Rhodobacteraceae bacterium]|nr:gamma-glutamyltransferase [Paracoccaceae bacterium]